MKTLYHNRLTHIAPVGATFFVTFRLADSLPQSLVNTLKRDLAFEIDRLKNKFPSDYIQRIRHAKKQNFSIYEHYLDAKPYGACYLKQPDIAEILIAKIMAYDGKLFDLQAYCIMPNHVHVLFSFAIQVVDHEGVWPDEIPEHYVQLDKVMQLIKGGSAYTINRRLGRVGNLWFKDSYDHFVRNEREWLNIVLYIMRNPVKAGLATKWDEWPFNYCKPRVLEKLMFQS